MIDFDPSTSPTFGRTAAFYMEEADVIGEVVRIIGWVAYLFDDGAVLLVGLVAILVDATSIDEVEERDQVAAVSCCDDPVGRDDGATADVEGANVDELAKAHLPRELAILGSLAANDATTAGGEECGTFGCIVNPPRLVIDNCISPFATYFHKIILLYTTLTLNILAEAEPQDGDANNRDDPHAVRGHTDCPKCE